MEWTEEGIVLGVRRHGEGSVILELMTPGHGRHLGLVRGGGGARLRPVLQPGNTVRATWRARLDEHLGHFAVEGLRLRAGDLLPLPQAVYAVSHLASLVRLLPERDPHPEVYARLADILDHVADPAAAASRLVLFEMRLLADLGFGLDVTHCAATGATRDLAYVSPKSGRAVSRAAGEPWRDRLFQLPAFMAGELDAPLGSADIEAGFALTEYFLVRHVLEPRGEALSQARGSFIATVLRLLTDATAGHQRSAGDFASPAPRK